MADLNDQMTSDERRRLLELLATSDDGCTADLLLALGFTPDLVLGVVRAGLATAQTENVLAGGVRSRCPCKAQWCQAAFPLGCGENSRGAIAQRHCTPVRLSRCDCVKTCAGRRWKPETHRPNEGKSIKSLAQ